MDKRLHGKPLVWIALFPNFELPLISKLLSHILKSEPVTCRIPVSKLYVSVEYLVANVDVAFKEYPYEGINF